MEKVVRIFASFAEADNADAESDARLTPEERLRIAMELRELRHPDAAQQGLQEFVALLNSNEVEYLVVGAFAVAYHGFPRYTGDLDLLVRPTPENAQRVLRTLSQFNFGSLGVRAQDLVAEGKIIQLGIRPNRIDLVTSISGVSFDQAWASRSAGSLDGIPVQFIGKADLIHNKESTGRAKDLGDAEELRKRSGKS